MAARLPILLAFLLALAALPALAQPPQTPPLVRGDTTRARRAVREWKLDDKLFSPNDDSTAALFDLEQLYQMKLASRGLVTDAKAAAAAERYVLDELSTIRYLSLANIPSAMRSEMWELVSFWVNSLSRTPDIIRPALGGPSNTLIRIDLSDYDIRGTDWDTLAVQEPYHNQDITVISSKTPAITTKAAPGTIVILTQPGADISVDGTFIGKGPELKRTTAVLEVDSQYFYNVTSTWTEDGKQRKATQRATMQAGKTTTVDLRKEGEQNELVVVSSGKTVRAMAAWINPEVNKRLAFLTGSAAPVTRADWWLANASVAPAYYDLLRIKTLDDFKALVAFDKKAEDLKEIRATVVKSGSGGVSTPVARNNRILSRSPTFQGNYWQTFDFLTSIKAANVINNFLNIKAGKENSFEVGELSGLKNAKEWLKQARAHLVGFKDASEIIGNLPNGLQAYLLTDGQDKVINEADIKIAYDLGAADLRVRSARSCVTCHTNGHQKFLSHFQLEVSPKSAIDLGIYLNDEKRVRALVQYIRSSYGTPEFEDYIQNDQTLYRKAVAASNGAEAPKNAASFNYFYNSYAEVDLDLTRVCLEIGLQPNEVKALLTLRPNGANNGVLIQQLLQPPIAIRRDQFEEAFSDLAMLSLLLKKHP
jgi:hypothetical protein